MFSTLPFLCKTLHEKGKIEWWFDLMKTQWMRNLIYKEFPSLEALGQSFSQYVVS